MKRPKKILTDKVIGHLTTQFNNRASCPNPFLLESQKAWKNAEAIRDLHYWRFGLHEVMATCPEVDLPIYDDLCDGLEMCLQDSWKFPRDYRRFMFWERPRCTCPKYDNEDRYPNGNYIYSIECPVHKVFA